MKEFKIEFLAKQTDYTKGGQIKCYENGKGKIVFKLNEKLEKTYENKDFSFNLFEKVILSKKTADLKNLILESNK